MSEVKKNIDSLNLEKVSAILLDVAGTTTAINFVKDTLLPYVTKTIEEFLKNSWEDEEVKKAVSQFEEKDLDVTKATEIVKTLTEKNDTNIGLKTIQGLIFKKGYESGDLKGHIFADVPICLESWSKSKKIAIFSTGSVESQQLLFKNTVEGDLSSHISKYFDQSVGIKNEADSYKKIAEELDTLPENILFLTDDNKEAEAAKSANLISVLVEREGNSPIPEDISSTFVVIKSFADIPLETVKRKIEEESAEQPPTKIAKTEEKETVSEDVETIENEVTEKKQKIEKNSTIEEKCEEPMEVDVEENSTTTTKDEDGKSEDVEETNKEKVSVIEEKPIAVKKSDIEQNSSKEEKHIKTDKITTEETPITESKTETKTKSVPDEELVTDEKPATEEKILTEESTIKDKPVVQEKDVPIIDKLESLEVEHKVETQTKSEENEIEKTKECLETGKIKVTAETKEIGESTETKEIAVSTETKEVEGMDTTEDKTKETVSDEPRVPENAKEGKTEIEIGTQTKTITNECETQTTISIKVAEELPVKDVQAKLLANESENDAKIVVSEQGKTEPCNKADKKEILGDKTEEEKKKEVQNTEKEKIGEVCDAVEVTEKEKVADTSVKVKEGGEDECKLEKTKADNSVKEVEENKVPDDKDSNKLTDLQQSSEVEKTEDKEVNKSNDEPPKENGVHEEKSSKVDEVIEEKENKSELANGKDNCVSNGEASNSSVGTVETKEEEIKVKTIEDKVENKPVSVEA